MSGISNINLAMSGSSYGAYSQKLTQATKQKLDELGITYSNDMTEQEGKKIIAQYQTSKSENSSNNSSSMFNQNQSTDYQRQRLEELARRLGISVSDGQSNEDLISIIEAKLEERIKSAQDNESELQILKSMSRELASIQAMKSGSMGFDSTNQALSLSLEMLAQYNKNLIKQH